MGSAGGLPAGTVTFLFADREGSTRLLQAHAYRDAVRRHHALLREAVEGHGGAVFETVGDAVYAVFARPTDATAAALAGQVALQREDWGALGTADALRARMALHTGEVGLQAGRYVGAPLYCAGRLLPTVRGGQVAVSEATVALVRDALPEGAGLRDLGAHRLLDRQRPERIYQLLHPALPADLPSLATLETRPHNLPLQLTSFVGRERDAAHLANLLATHRAVTLTGPGGVGKTRLALRVAAEAHESFPDGAWLVELAGLADPVLVPQTVATAVGVREERGHPALAALVDALRPRRLLLLLDHCEHLVGACAALAEAILRACPHARLLATSRAPLRVSGEREFPVPPLRLPGPAGATTPEALAEVEAVRLFVERAQTSDPAFVLADENAAAVAELCRRLDGLPLALELAAARLRVLPVAHLLERLEDRFRLLTGGSRAAPPRHQALGATLDWSYRLLDDRERRLFERLAVFAGGWTLEAAEAVGAGGAVTTEAVLDLLTHLVEQSLAVHEPRGARARYVVLETVREYALGRLEASGEADAVRRRHARHFLALAEQGGAGLTGPEQARWLERLEAERDNLRAALRWALERGEPETALRLAGALWRFWHMRGDLGEGRRWLEQALGAPGAGAAAPAVRARALTGAGVLAHYQGDVGRAAALCGESLAISRGLPDPGETVDALLGLALVARAGGNYAPARAMYEESLALARARGDAWRSAYTATYGGLVRWMQGDVPGARRWLGEGLAGFKAAGDRWGVGRSLNGLGDLAIAQREYATGRALQEEALATQEACGDRLGVIRSLSGLGDAALGSGDPSEARRHHERCVSLLGGLGDRVYLARCLTGLAVGAAKEGRRLHAARLFGAAAAVLEATGAVEDVLHGLDHATWMGRVRAALGPAAFASAFAAGRVLSPAEAVAAGRAVPEAPAPPTGAGATQPPAAPPPAAAATPGGPPVRLTARERDVLRLVVQGRSDAAIGEALHLSVRTVNWHLGSLLGKTGCPNRTALATWAARHEPEP